MIKYIHLALMTLMSVLLTAGILTAMTRKSGWLKKHKALNITGAACGLTGVICMILFKALNSWPHFRTLHAVLGLAARDTLRLLQRGGAQLLQDGAPALGPVRVLRPQRDEHLGWHRLGCLRPDARARPQPYARHDQDTLDAHREEVTELRVSVAGRGLRLDPGCSAIERDKRDASQVAGVEHGSPRRDAAASPRERGR